MKSNWLIGQKKCDLKTKSRAWNDKKNYSASCDYSNKGKGQFNEFDHRRKKYLLFNSSSI